MKQNINTDDFTLPASPWLWLMNTGLLLIVAGTALPLLHIEGDMYRYLYTAGALLALIGRIFAPGYKGSILRVRRLGRIELWSCIIFCAGAFFMWYNKTQAKDWLAFTLAGGALQIYTSLMIPRTLSKEMKLRSTKKTDENKS